MSIEDLSTVETLDRYPFKHMVATIGNLPTSFVDSMSYYECIAWLVKYLETTVIPTVNNNSACVEELQGKFIELIALFEELKSYVDNYFENLDVQEEINNKLDDMAEAGTLTDIIAGYIQLKGILAYDTVADLKAATNVVDGSFAETYGFYEKGDGGGAKYKIRAITNDDTIDESTIIEITADPTNTLIAELVMSAEMNVKQFGCTGDGETDETNKFNKAIANCKKLYVNAGTYILNRFLPEENQEIIGIGEAIIKLNGTTAPLVNFKSNSRITNLDIRSMNANLVWNRSAIDNKSNIILDGCKISGFRHDSAAPNAWGILMQSASNITIKNCYFDNNSQSDIAIVNNCKNINIDQCSGTSLYINIEPTDALTTNDNIAITNCDLNQLNLLENSYTGTATQSVLVSNCHISLLEYDGGTATLINTIVDDVKNEGTNVIFAGVLSLNNSMNLSNNILTDPYLDCFHNSTTSTLPWYSSYFSSAIASSIETIKDENGIQTVFNPGNATNLTARMQHQPVTVTAGEKYILRVNSKTHYPSSGVNYASLNFVLVWNDSNNTQVARQVISLNRSTTNTTTPFTEQSAVLVVPTGAVSLSIQPCVATAPDAGVTGSQSFYVRSIELLKFNGGTPNTIESLPIRDKRVFTLGSALSGQGTQYKPGDILEFETPSTYIGQVCTVAGYGNSATWKNFGEIAA